jgi:sulfofructose kinase
MTDGASRTSPRSTDGPRVVCVGIATLDRVFRVPGLPTGAGKRFATGFAEVGGGPAATAAATVARLGGRAELWTRVGTDATGAAIIDELRGWGVGVDHVRRIAGAVSQQAAVTVDAAGERAIVSFRDPALDRDPSWLPLDRIGGSDGVLADVRWPEGAAAALAAARRAGVIAVLDADLTDDDALDRLVPLASHVAFSAPGLSRFVGTDDPSEGLARAADRTDGKVCVTLGAEGCLWRDGPNVRHLPAFAVEAVDTLGAGDVFHGALALALGRGSGHEEALRYASATAALKCRRFGGRSGIPDGAEVAAFIEERV